MGPEVPPAEEPVVDMVLNIGVEEEPGAALVVCVIGPAATLLVADVEELIGAVGLTVVVITVVTMVVVIYEVVMYVVGALLIMIVFPSPKILLICDAD